MQEAHMLKIGLTGGIASGKSTVLDFFKKKDVPYIDADVVAREVVDLGTPGLAAIRELFGDTVILDDGRLIVKRLVVSSFTMKKNGYS